MACGSKPYQRYLTGNSKFITVDQIIELKPDVLGKVEALPFLDGCFDSILCTEVLEHLPEPQEAMKELKRVLKEDGYLYLSVPQSWYLHYEPNDYFRFTKYGIKHLLEKDGFAIIYIERIGGVVSLVAQRIIDVTWQLSVDYLKLILGLRWAERIASGLISPFSVLFYLLTKLGDKIDKKDALGWAVLARNKKG